MPLWPAIKLMDTVTGVDVQPSQDAPPTNYSHDNASPAVKLEPCFIKSWSTSGDSDGDSFSFADSKPTGGVEADDNSLVVDWLAEDHRSLDDIFIIDDGLAVDPTDTNVWDPQTSMTHQVSMVQDV